MARPTLHSHSSTLRIWLPVIIGVIALYVILPQVAVFKHSLQAIPGANYKLLLLAGSAVGLTFVFGAAVYVTLAYRRLSYTRSLVAQLAANFFNRILPAGVGGIGANYRYLRQHRHSAAQAASVVTANNGLGIVGHLLLLLSLVVFFQAHLAPVHSSNKTVFVVCGVLLLAVIVALAIPTVRRRIVSGFGSLSGQLIKYAARPGHVIVALMLQLGLTASNVVAFWLCVLALHASISFVAALLIFTFGFGVGTAVPTPGGLGGVEAGLVAGLVAYHQTASTALAAVLVYRLISYWLPLLISAPFCVYATKRHYFAN